MSDHRDDFIISIRYALLKKGAKEKFSLFFLIIFSILIITLDRLSVPFISSARALMKDIVYEISFIASTPAKILSYLNVEKNNYFYVVKKNEILKKEIEILKNDQQNILFIKTENKSLKAALDLPDIRDQNEQSSIKARVLLDKDSPFLHSLIINKGKKDAVIKGMSVFSKNYLIGTIVESNYFTARVLLITDLNSKIPIIIQDSAVNAILAGKSKSTNLSLEYLPEGFILEPNKIIYTSGKDGFLASGLPVGESYFNKKKNKVQIKSLANPDQAFIVHVTNGKSSN